MRARDSDLWLYCNKFLYALYPARISHLLGLRGGSAHQISSCRKHCTCTIRTWIIVKRPRKMRNALPHSLVCDGSLRQSLSYICSPWIMFSLSCRKQAEAQFLQEGLHSQGQKCRRRRGNLKMGTLGFASCFWVLLNSTDCCPQMDCATWRLPRWGLLLNQPHQQLGTESSVSISSRSGAAQSTT
jgi:hypothetical protein